VNSAAAVLNEIMASQTQRIPQWMLADARGIAIIPNVVKGGFVVGIRHGKGVVMTRDDAGAWNAPWFVSLTGGSIGWQAGVQATDVILVFKTQKSINGLMNGKFTIGADAAAAAGPVGRQAAAATDATLGAEIYSYSRSRGLFAGVSLDGSALQIDAIANQLYYGGAGVTAAGPQAGQAAHLPQSAARLIQLVAGYTAAPHIAPPATHAVPLARDPLDAEDAPVHSERAIREELAAASQRLQAILDDHWKRYLALPAEVYSAEQPPAFQAVTDTLMRYDTITKDPLYRMLAQRAEFQKTHALLKKYRTSLTTAADTKLTLPPPPAQSSSNSGWSPRY
jgi:lipid-binding SYLF domain-containing protein